MSYAVVTGDIVESSKIKTKSQKETLNNTLRDAFDVIRQLSTEVGTLPAFNIFRGDSFQGLFTRPEEALRAVIYIRAVLRKNQPDETKNSWDARMAVGTGTIEYLTKNITEGDGQAYQNSGPVLDKLKGSFRCAVQTPNQEINNEYKALCSLLDAVIARWTPSQAEVIAMKLQGMAPKEMAEELDISQAAIHYRMKGASWFAIDELLQRNRQIMEKV